MKTNAWQVIKYSRERIGYIHKHIFIAPIRGGMTKQRLGPLWKRVATAKRTSLVSNKDYAADAT